MYTLPYSETRGACKVYTVYNMEKQRFCLVHDGSRLPQYVHLFVRSFSLIRSLLAFLFAPYSTMIIIITRRRTTTTQHNAGIDSYITKNDFEWNEARCLNNKLDLCLPLLKYCPSNANPFSFNLSFFGIFFIFVSFFHLFSMRKNALFTCILVGRMILNILVCRQDVHIVWNTENGIYPPWIENIHTLQHTTRQHFKCQT